MRLECLAELDNTASCVVLSESPANWGFGDAAMMLRCTVIYEAPDGAGFGDAGVRFATTHLAGAGASALPREVYIPFLFRPD